MGIGMMIHIIGGNHIGTGIGITIEILIGGMIIIGEADLALGMVVDTGIIMMTDMIHITKDMVKILGGGGIGTMVRIKEKEIQIKNLIMDGGMVFLMKKIDLLITMIFLRHG